MSERPRLLYVAPRPARPTTSGQVLMHRHLSALDGRFTIGAAHPAVPAPGDPAFDLLPLSSLYRRLRDTRWRRWSEGVNALTGYALPRRHLRAVIRRQRPDVAVVVAESPVFLPAVAAARQAGVPVVSILHDWSNVWLDFPRRLRPAADRRFLAACRRSTITLSVSPELAHAVGTGERHRLLYPIPGNEALPDAHAGGNAAFSVVYAGVFHYFHHAEMGDLCAELLRRGRANLLRVYGPAPDWTTGEAQPVKTANVYAGLVAQAQVPAILAAAGALLVICPFHDNMAAFARYSFPSKLTEYCRFGRPIVLWGPPSAAAVRWAAASGAVVQVTERDPAAVVDALLALERDAALRRRLGTAAAREAATTFSPDRLQTVFETALRDAMATRARSVGAPVSAPAHGY